MAQVKLNWSIPHEVFWGVQDRLQIWVRPQPNLLKPTLANPTIHKQVVGSKFSSKLEEVPKVISEFTLNLSEFSTQVHLDLKGVDKGSSTVDCNESVCDEVTVQKELEQDLEGVLDSYRQTHFYLYNSECTKIYSEFANQLHIKGGELTFNWSQFYPQNLSALKLNYVEEKWTKPIAWNQPKVVKSNPKVLEAVQLEFNLQVQLEKEMWLHKLTHLTYQNQVQAAQNLKGRVDQLNHQPNLLPPWNHLLPTSLKDWTQLQRVLELGKQELEQVEGWLHSQSTQHQLHQVELTNNFLKSHNYHAHLAQTELTHMFDQTFVDLEHQLDTQAKQFLNLLEEELQ